MRDYRDRSSSHSPDMPAHRKRLGGYLVEAGLLTPAQIDVALNDQKLTGMRFGEILAARGWVKQQTIEYLMQKVVLPEQTHDHDVPDSTTDSRPNATPARSAVVSNASANNGTAANIDKRSHVRRDLPITKPLPAIHPPDGDVSWVG